jgi:[amino group carrier protein]-lysine/ornithine hydrolase
MDNGFATPITRETGAALLRGLVETPSLSGQEDAAVALLVDWMNAHGLAAHVDPAGNANGLLASEPAAGGRPTRTIVMLGHIDTVHGQPPVREEDGKLYGRGTVDAKGPLAAFAVAAARAGVQPGWRIQVVGAVEEEAATSKGARYLAASQSRPDMVIIGEPSGWMRLTLGYKGRLLATVTVEQPLAHRSGGAVTACELAVAFWNRAGQAIADLNTGRSRAWDQVLPALRSFCSSDDGLCETATLELGFRLPPDQAPDTIKHLLCSVDGITKMDFSGEEMAYQASKNTPLVRAFLAGIRAQGGEPGFLLKTGTSDMNVVGPVWNCPILAYGPGDSRLDHTPEEHVDLDEWWQGVLVLENVLCQLPAL